MKILLVNKYHYIKGGSETYFFGLGKLLEKHGHKVIYFSMEDEQNYPCKYQKYFSKNVDFNGNLSAFGKIKAGFHALYSFDAKRKMEQLIKAEKPDVVHINLVHRHITLSILDVIKKYNIPVVFTAHDLNCICPSHTMIAGDGSVCSKCVDQGSYKPALKQKCVKGSFMQTLLAVIEAKNYQLKGMYNKIDYYICPSEFYRNQFEKSAITNNVIAHWTNFLPMGTEYKLAENTKDYFLYFGRISVEKGIFTLIKAYQKGNFANPLYIVGDGPLREELENYVAEHNLAQKVIFTGFQSGDALKKYVSQAKCVILPSEWYENGPYSILEALAIGKPVIVSNNGGLPELVDENINGFICEPNNPDSLCSCLTQINNLTDAEYRNMCLASLNKAKDQCHCDKYYEKLINCYNDLLSKPRKA